MSAGIDNVVTAPKVVDTLDVLAPKFACAVGLALAECNAKGLDAFVYESYRTEELQKIYYARGRTVKPPQHTVTNAKSNLYSWHGFGLAVDVISKSKRWSVSRKWLEDVAEIFEKHGLDWGGDWKIEDLFHFQWGECRATPSDRAREILHRDGLEAVWRAVDAMDAMPSAA